MTLASWITVSRLLLLPAVVWPVTAGWDDAWLISAALTAFAGLTDVLDGFVARRLRQCSSFGQDLDLIVDKAFVLATLVLLTVAAGMPAWVPAIVALREAGVSLVRWSQYGRGRLAPDVWGKAKTVLTFVAMVALMLQQDFKVGGTTAGFLGFPLASRVLLHAQWLMFAAVALSVMSGLNYVIGRHTTLERTRRSPEKALGR